MAPSKNQRERTTSAPTQPGIRKRGRPRKILNCASANCTIASTVQPSHETTRRPLATVVNGVRTTRADLRQIYPAGSTDTDTSTIELANSGVPQPIACVQRFDYKHQQSSNLSTRRHSIPTQRAAREEYPETAHFTDGWNSFQRRMHTLAQSFSTRSDRKPLSSELYQKAIVLDNFVETSHRRPGHPHFGYHRDGEPVGNHLTRYLNGRNTSSGDRIHGSNMSHTPAELRATAELQQGGWTMTEIVGPTGHSLDPPAAFSDPARAYKYNQQREREERDLVLRYNPEFDLDRPESGFPYTSGSKTIGPM